MMTLLSPPAAMTSAEADRQDHTIALLCRCGADGQVRDRMRNALSRTDVDVDINVEQWQHTLAKRLPPYKVLLHNDDYHSMDYVVRVLCRVIHSLSRAAALTIMYQAHVSGVAVATVCPQELAEHYRDGLRSYGLSSTIEPDC
jgi:ATP-dependent Clp protease adaptor protein ClpS